MNAQNLIKTLQRACPDGSDYIARTRQELTRAEIFALRGILLGFIVKSELNFQPEEPG